MTVKIKLKQLDNQTTTMLFGDSYKSWHTQFAEFVRANKPIEVLEAHSSSEPWISYGGLKWCELSEFSGCLTEEGEQREVSDFQFVENKLVLNKAKRIVKNGKKN